MSKTLEKIDSSISIIGNKVSPRSGAFEVTLNNRLIFSKFKTGTFPTEEIIKGWLN